MDCQMLEMDGYEATKIIRSMPQYEDLPIIAMTAHALKGDSEHCLAAGMDDFLSKPVWESMLDAMLVKWLPPFKCEKVERPTETAPQLGAHKFEFIDAQALAELTEITQERMPHMLRLYIENSDKSIDAIEEGLSRGDKESIMRAAHTLKSSSGQVGALKAQEAALQLEIAARGTATAETLAKLAAVLKEHYKNAKNEIEKIIAEKKGLREKYFYDETGHSVG